MGLFDLGSGELIIIMVVALLLFGPEKLIDIARTLGKTVASLKKTANEFTSEVTKEIDAANKATTEVTTAINKEINSANKAVSEATAQINSNLNYVVTQTNRQTQNMTSPPSTSNAKPATPSIPQPAPSVESVRPPTSHGKTVD